MKTKIKELIEYTKRINVTVLAASLTFYAILIIAPVINIILSILGELQINTFQDYAFSNTLSILSIIIVGINSIWVSSKLINITFIISDIIYVDIPKRSTFKVRLKAFGLMFILVWLIVLEIVALLAIITLANYIRINQNINGLYYITVALEFFVQFVSIVLIIGFIYKYVIPIKISFKTTFLVGLIVSLVWYVLTYFYRIVCNVFNLWGNEYVYGSMTNFLVMAMWIYLLCLVFIYGLILTFYLTKMCKNKKDGYNNTEQERSNRY